MFVDNMNSAILFMLLHLWILEEVSEHLSMSHAKMYNMLKTQQESQNLWDLG